MSLRCQIFLQKDIKNYKYYQCDFLGIFYNILYNKSVLLFKEKKDVEISENIVDLFQFMEMSLHLPFEQFQ